MRSPNQVKAPQPITIEQTLSLIKSIMDRYLPEKPHAYYTGRQGAGPERAIRWGFGIVSPKSATSDSLGEYVLTIWARHGAFGEVKEVTKRKWWSLSSVTEAEITNALMAALTFRGSPYQFNGTKWVKRVEVM
jgi:hypothetical protein